MLTQGILTCGKVDSMSLKETTRLNQLMGEAILARVVWTIADLGLPDLIDRGATRPVSELAAALGCDERTSYRTLRFLASYGFFEERPPQSFALTPLAEALRSDAPDSFRAAARLFDRTNPALQEFPHSLRTGESALTKALGEGLFSYMMKAPETAAIFDAAMTSMHGNETPAMLEAYDFSGIGTLADVGGGNASLLTGVLGKYPDLKGLLVDLGHVAERGKDNLRAAGLAERCGVAAGDFFESIPQGADAYLLRHIIHDWSDEDSLRILKNCRKAVPTHGRLLIVETVIPAGNDPSPAKVMDMMMLIYPGGMERTKDEYSLLFQASGFELTRIVPTATPVSVIEGRPV